MSDKRRIIKREKGTNDIKKKKMLTIALNELKTSSDKVVTFDPNIKSKPIAMPPDLSLIDINSLDHREIIRNIPELEELKKLDPEFTPNDDPVFEVGIISFSRKIIDMLGHGDNDELYKDMKKIHQSLIDRDNEMLEENVRKVIENTEKMPMLIKHFLVFIIDLVLT